MPKTQNKNIIGWTILSLVFLLLGEGLFSLGIYLIPLLKISSKDWSFFVALGLGVLASLMTGTSVGLISLLLIIYVMAARGLIGVFRDNLLVLGLLVVAANLVIDKVAGSSWSIGESIVCFGMTLMMGMVFGTDHELKLKR
jgi:hypothetical protein